MELRNLFKKNNSKNTAQNSCEFNKKNTPKKFLKIFAAASLALITCATTLLATAPFGTGRASAATNSNLSNTTQTTSPLGLDPENDPVVYTTASGLEIKYANGKLSSGPLNGYAYLTMGTYTDSTTNTSYPVNWVIIGKSTTFPTNTYNSWASWQGMIPDRTMPDSVTSAAGQAIHQDSLKGQIYSTFALSNAVPKDIIPSGCVLVISEYVLFNCQFRSSLGGEYGDSILQDKMLSLYEKDLGLNSAEQEAIQPQNVVLYTTSGFTVSATTYQDQTFFPLQFFFDSTAYGSDPTIFRIKDYLTTAALRIAYSLGTTTPATYHTGSTTNATNKGLPAIINTNGEQSSITSATYSAGCRPACVLKLT